MIYAILIGYNPNKLHTVGYVQADDVDQAILISRLKMLICKVNLTDDLLFKFYPVPNETVPIQLRPARHSATLFGEALAST